MKYCTNCGNPLQENVSFCSNCGTAVTQTAAQPSYEQPTYAQPNYAQPNYAQPNYIPPAKKDNGTVTAIKVLMIVSTVIMGLYIFPLAWCLPMTISYYKKVEQGAPISTGFKICTLLFVNTIAGILMLCDNSN